MKLWVITLGNLNWPEPIPQFVLSVLSPRKDTAYIQEYLENIYLLLLGDLEMHVTRAKYTKPQFLNRAIRVSEHEVYLVDTPYIVRGQKSNMLGTRNENGNRFLQWQGLKYERWTICPKTSAPQFLEEVNPKITEAKQMDFSTSKLYTR